MIDWNSVTQPGDLGPDPEQPDVPAHRRRKRARQHQKSIEALYGDLIRAGLVRIVRRKGRPPLIEYL